MTGLFLSIGSGKNAETVGEAFAYTPSRETNGCGKPATAEPPVITSKPWADSAPTLNNLNNEVPPWRA